MDRPDFPDDAWMELRTAIGLISLGLIVVARSRVVGKLRELRALFRCFSLKRTPPDLRRSELVGALVRDFHDVEPLDHRARAQITAVNDNPELAGHEVVLAGARAARLLCTYASTAEAQAVHRWVMWMAYRVATASGRGWLGWGRKLTDEKQHLLRQLDSVLSAPCMAQAPSPAELEVLLG